jgi:HEAT repeat protein
MVWTVRKDESDRVVESALGFFNSSGDDSCILNRLPPGQKAALLSPLLRALQNSANWGLRNNAALSLRFYPEQRKVVTPVLLKGLKDPQPQVQLLAAEALIRVDPEAASKAGVTSILVAISKNPDDQIAWKAVTALGGRGSQLDLDLAVPALVECLRSTNSLVACSAVWALEYAGKEFETYSNTIVPALISAAERTNDAAGHARNALARWKPSAAAGPSK